MAFTLNITFQNDALNAEMRDAFADLYGWSATLPDGSPNPETKAAFREKQIKKFCREVVAGARARADEAARSTRVLPVPE